MQNGLPPYIKRNALDEGVLELMSPIISVHPWLQACIPRLLTVVVLIDEVD